MQAERIFSLLFLLVCIGAGCSQTVEQKPLLVSGTVRVNGQPAGGACIRFHKASDLRFVSTPSATRCEADGTFSLPIPVAGDYFVTLFWPKITIEEGEEIEGHDQLRDKFKDPRRPLQKISIAEEVTQLAPIEVRVDSLRS